jgi:hypothetical protein
VAVVHEEQEVDAVCIGRLVGRRLGRAARLDERRMPPGDHREPTAPCGAQVICGLSRDGLAFGDQNQQILRPARQLCPIEPRSTGPCRARHMACAKLRRGAQVQKPRAARLQRGAGGDGSDGFGARRRGGE